MIRVIPTCYAFHEGFSDIVAIFQHFSFEGVLRDEIQRTRTDLLSQQYARSRSSRASSGTPPGSGQALRTATMQADTRQYERLLEAHDRGSLLVAAIFEAFFHDLSAADARISSGSRRAGREACRKAIFIPLS